MQGRANELGIACACFAALVGCFAPSAPAGAPCGPGGRCPTGQTCVADVCTIEGATAPDGFPGRPGDDDGDGVPNEEDNCRDVANEDQHDEDGDGIGDLCDNCPHVANADQANVREGAQRDAVGDACDPNPTTGGDEIALFLPFHRSPSSAIVEGPWTPSGDAFRLAQPEAAAVIANQAGDALTIQIAGRQTAQTSESWVVVTGGETGSRFHTCGYLSVAPANGQPGMYFNPLIEHYDGAAWDFLDADLASGPVSGAFVIRMFVDSVADRIRCEVNAAALEVGNVSTLAPGRFGLRADGAALEIDYLIAFRRTTD
ncbi:MAG: thrombospondin type 3 repeat-containing protein [Kofleriaceae bacterium]